MEFTGRIKDMTFDYKTKLPMVQFAIKEKNALENLEQIKDEVLEIRVIKKHDKRSLDANAYMWVMLGELQEVLQVPKEDIYRDLIKKIGSYEVLPIRIDAVEKFQSVWQNKGLGWITETIPSKLEGYINVIAYYGSSCYDKKEMARLIDAVIQECHQLKIPTKEDKEIEKLIEEWEC